MNPVGRLERGNRQLQRSQEPSERVLRRVGAGLIARLALSPLPPRWFRQNPETLAQNPVA